MKGDAIRVLARPAFRTRKWNPYNWLLYTHLRAAGVTIDESTRRRVIRGSHDILHLHWPEQHLNHPGMTYAFARSLTLLAQIWWVRLHGTRVIWTVHNLGAHERRYPRFERWFWGALTRQLDAFICLTEASRNLATVRFPSLGSIPGHVIPHGDYREAYPNHTPREESRARLGIEADARVLLFIGAIREYKNVPALIRTFRDVTSPQTILLVAGRPTDASIRGEVETLAAADARVRLHLDFVADDELQLFLNAADAVVLPYRETLNSGSAILALSFDRPVLLPTSACGQELQRSVGDAWVRTYEGALEPRALEETVEWAAAREPYMRPDLSDLSWPRIARLTRAAYGATVGAPAEAVADAAPEPTAPPLVSIITPCYNAAAFVPETIESVRRQTYTSIEHIVVDDCSTDGSWAAIQEHASTVRGVRLPRNRGGCHARNHGAALARGEYLMFLDADDTLSPGTIAALVDALRDRPGAAAFCDWHRLQEVNGTWTEQRRELPLPAEDQDPLAGWLEGVWVPPCAILWTRAAFECTGGWDEELTINQDGDIMMRALSTGVPLARAPQGLAFYREHGAGRLTVSGATFSFRQLRSLERVLEKLELSLRERGTLERYRKSLGVAFQRIALTAYRQSAYEYGGMWEKRGRQYGGRRSLSRTLAGRALTWVLGGRRKERVVEALANWGVSTAARRRSIRIRSMHAVSAPGGVAGGRARGDGVPSAPSGSRT
jgi:beta-1,4-mannosyltransferase